MHNIGQHRTSRAFALPTVLIASTVLLIVLAVSVTATTAVRTALKGQYYTQLAQIAGEAGVAYAQACLAENGNVPQWSDAKPLTPATDCFGNMTGGSGALMDVLVIGGGGGGGSAGGGGGAGEYNLQSNVFAATGSYPVTVGAGGNGGAAGSTLTQGANGASSIFSNITSIGGGGGGAGAVGSSGGNGGGGGSPNFAGGTGTSGNDGGLGSVGGNGGYPDGGGAGAGAPGGAGNLATIGGNGGVGLTNSITGSSVTYAGGGGAGETAGAPGPGTVGLGGAGGGTSVAAGAGSGVKSAAGTSASANTGSGGGGGSLNGSTYMAGGNGGSGVVIISYPTSSSITATGGTVTTVGGNKIHTFSASGSNFVVTSNGTVDCPNDPKCFVTVNGNIKSSFKVGLPTLDVDGRAVTIPNTGYVQIFRTSTNSVWRTYTQPNVQSAAVPDLCSGSATGSLGWSNAVKATTQDAFAPTANALSISNSVGGTSPGTIHFRKDFYVPAAGVYKASVFAPTLNDTALIYVDGTYLATSNGSLAVGQITLSQGCHNVVVQLTNPRIRATANRTRMTASVKSDTQSTPVAATDPSWRWDVGQVQHYSDVNFFADPSVWMLVRDIQSATTYSAGWSAASSDYFARWVSTAHSYSSNNYPASSWAYFRDSRDVTVATTTQVKVSMICDDFGVVYLDGVAVVNSAASNTCGSVINTTTLTLTPGKHRFGFALGNSTLSPSGFALAVTRTSDNVALTYTDDTWRAADYWAGGLIDLLSYDKTFVPTPNTVAKTPTATVLLVGGGGGGGGNGGGGGGAGGVVLDESVPLTVGSYAVTIGPGGAGSASSSVPGTRGTATTLAGYYSAVGGGAGASRDGGGAGLSGASGGGGAGSPVPQSNPGFTSSSTQGNSGGAGYDNTCGSAGGGGGGFGSAGNVGINNLAGNGGSGYITYITGSVRILAGGGAGGFTCAPGVAGRANGGGGAGSGVAGTANTGGGGAGGGPSTVGAAGGSGIAIIAYPSASMTATGGTKTTANGYTIHTFTANGTLTVTAVQP